MQFIYKRQYLKRFDRFPTADQARILAADEQIRTCYLTQKAPFGLRIKQLYTKAGEKVLEARASQDIRILWAERKDTVSFVLVGTHDEVKRYLRSLR
jgi:hypothetical protein